MPDIVSRTLNDGEDEEVPGTETRSCWWVVGERLGIFYSRRDGYLSINTGDMGCVSLGRSPWWETLPRALESAVRVRSELRFVDSRLQLNGDFTTPERSRSRRRVSIAKALGYIAP
jgi:hypothetical protein